MQWDISDAKALTELPPLEVEKPLFLEKEAFVCVKHFVSSSDCPC